MNKWIGIVLLVGILAYLAPNIVRTIRLRGYLKGEINNLHPGVCKNIPGIENGCEQFELLPNGKMLITSGLVWPPGAPIPPNHRGKILLLDLNQSEPSPIDIPIKGNLDLSKLSPVGMSKWIDPKSGDITLLVVNVLTECTVERFKYSELENVLHHIETIRDPNFHLLDDVAATGERSFYFTNFFGAHLAVEALFHFAWSSVGYYNGQESMIVDTGLGGANGVVISLDGKYVYVNMCFDEYMRSYKRNTDNSLEKIEDIHVNFAPDNVIIDSNGDLILTGPIIASTAFAYLDDPTVTCPTQATQLTMSAGKMTSRRDIFIDDGKLMSGGTVGIIYNNKLILGSVRSKAAICDMNSETD